MFFPFESTPPPPKKKGESFTTNFFLLFFTNDNLWASFSKRIKHIKLKDTYNNVYFSPPSPPKKNSITSAAFLWRVEGNDTLVGSNHMVWDGAVHCSTPRPQHSLLNKDRYVGGVGRIMQWWGMIVYYRMSKNLFFRHFSTLRHQSITINKCSEVRKAFRRLTNWTDLDTEGQRIICEGRLVQKKLKRKRQIFNLIFRKKYIKHFLIQGYESFLSLKNDNDTPWN